MDTIIVKELVDQIRSVVNFSGFTVESVASHGLFISLELISKKRFRKKNYHLAVSRSLNGILTAERELSRKYKGDILIYDPVNFLPEPTFSYVHLFHDLDALQNFLSE
ncbi:MAG: hypothetical protein JSV04_09865 [Candidatus Heimdallarchaeota archaeon]|nr:MAG: hypothetical protein JSV04_09865 [Candidatus Heimdallarchaeota archaeon]